MSLFKPAVAIDRLVIEGGTSRKWVDMARIGWQIEFPNRGQGPCGCDFSYVEFDVAKWMDKHDRISGDYLWEVGVKPVFRLQRLIVTPWFAVKGFLEGSVGIHYISEKSIDNTAYYTSTQYQFGEHLAYGFAFGKNNEFVIMQRFQHFSNGNTVYPNPGLNLRITHISYSF